VLGLDGRQKLLLVLLLLLAMVATYPGMFAHFTTRIPKIHMDTIEQIANVNWQNHFLFREPGLVFNMGTFYPHSLATFFGAPMFGISIWFGLFKMFGLNIYSQYNLFIVFALMIGAIGVFALTVEVSGKEKIYAFIAAVIYIVFNTHRALYIWPSIFSAFFVPWALLYFLRFLKSLHYRDLLLFLTCAAIQITMSEYVGVYLLVFFLPWMIIFALFFKKISLKTFLKISAGLVLVALLMIILYYPIISSFDGVTTTRSYRPGMLLNINDLFTTNHSFIYSQIFRMYLATLFNWFPGIIVSVFFFVSGFASDRVRSWPWIALTAIALLSIILLQKSHIRLGTILFLLLLSFFTASHLRQRRQNLPLTLLALAFAGYLLFFFNLLPMGLPRQAFPFSILASLVPYFQRMCEYKRVFVILIPIMAVFAAHSMRLLGRHRRWLPLILLGLIWLENFEPRIRDWGNSIQWDARAPIYATIPRQSDKVILEIPFFGGTEIWSLPSFFQSVYAYSTRFHWNFVVNGRNSFAPVDHQELARHALIPEVFEEENIEWLKRHYAVDYLIINWPELNPEEALHAMKRLPFLSAVGDKVLDIPQATVFQLQEKKEITVLERTYSAYHLRHRQILVRFRKPCSLLAAVEVSNLPWQEFPLNMSSELRFRIDPRRIGRDCEPVKIIFPKPVEVEEIRLCK
jgi:hypothetical protein